MAALCHDIGHLPFSHAVEHELLPDGWNHERLSRELITTELQELFKNMTPPLRAEQVAKLAVGPKKAKDLTFSPWEMVLSEIIVGDAFGVDRMDYLLRDSLHTGVAYGRFGHERLIDTLRILPSAVDESSNGHPTLGVEWGGLQSAEALLMARYFMYSQVYLHRVRLIYDRHLIDFLANYLPDGRFRTDTASHMSMTDNELGVAIREAAKDSSHSGYKWARRLADRDHFRVLYSRRLEDLEKQHLDPAKAIYQVAREEFGDDMVKIAQPRDHGGKVEFPVLRDNGSIGLSISESEVLNHLPRIAEDYVYVDKRIAKDASRWLKGNLHRIFGADTREEEDS